MMYDRGAFSVAKRVQTPVVGKACVYRKRAHQTTSIPLNDSDL